MRAIVTLVIGDEWKKHFQELYLQPMLKYAMRLNMPLHVIMAPIDRVLTFNGKLLIEQRNMAWQKLLIWTLPELDPFDEILFLDADIVCTQQTLNPFDYVPPTGWGLVSENINGMLTPNCEWVYKSRRLSPKELLLNTGVMVLRRAEHAQVMEDVYYTDSGVTIEVEAEHRGWYEEPYLSRRLVDMPGTLLARTFNRMVYHDIPRFGFSIQYWRQVYAENMFLHCAGDGKRPEMFSVLSTLSQEAVT